MKKTLLSALLMGSWLFISAQNPTHLSHQNVGVQKLVEKEFNRNPVKQVNDLFETSPLMSLKSSNVPKKLQGESLLTINKTSLSSIYKEAAESLLLSIPYKGEVLTMELVKQNIFSSGFKVSTNLQDNYVVKNGVHYRGMLHGDEKSLVAISVFDNDIVGLVATNDGNINLAKLENPDGVKALEGQFVLYNDHVISDEMPENLCATADDHYEGKSIKSKPTEGYKSSANCVNIYFEVDYGITQSKGGVTGAANYLEAVFNQVAILYQNEQVNTKISEIKVWETNDPYGSNINTVLSAFRSNKNSQGFNGDLAHYVSLDVSGGLAYVDVLCSQYNRYGVSQIMNSYQNVPTYSWTVEVVTHELGHNLGSPHTQSCSWAGGALDNCYTTEGGCSPGPAPTNGGTIMSYCHLTGYGINFNNGFGTQPGNLIRDRVYNAACLTSCATQDVCSTPVNISASNVGQTSLTVSWNAVSTAANYSFRYRKQGNSSWNTSTVNGTSKTLSGLTPLTSYEVQVLSNCSGETSDWSTSEVFTTLTDQTTYCSSKGNNASYEYIQKVQVGSFVNTSGNNGGYGDFTNQTINLNKNEAINILLTPGFQSSSYNETWTVWADLNNDGDFTDVGEQLYRSGNVSSVINANITIPSSAANGSTRMRISMKYNASSTACETFTYGEVEDYTINIQDAAVQPCNAPTGLATSNITTSAITVSWNAVGNATSYLLHSRVSGGSWSLQTVSGTSATLSGLNDNTTYEFRVASDCGSETSAYTNIIAATTEEVAQTCDIPSNVQASSITTNSLTVSWNAVSGASSYTVQARVSGGTWSSSTVATNSISLSGLNASTVYDIRVRTNCANGLASAYSFVIQATTEDDQSGPVDYCASSGSNSSQEWIASVRFGSNTYSTGNNGGYHDNTSQVINLTPGGSVYIQLKPGFTTTWFWTNSYPEYWNIWIDYNQDGDFDDAGELFASTGGTSSGTVSGTVGIPTGVSGTTRMRVAMRRNTGAPTCGNFDRGEVEDYTVNFGAPMVNAYEVASFSSNSVGALKSDVALGVSPNPTLGATNISLSLRPENGSSVVSVYDVTGRLITSTTIDAVQVATEQKVSINLSANATGTYLIVLETASGERKVERLVKH